MLYNNGPKIVTDGLVISLDAANNKSYPGSGTNWNDLSGNGNNCVFSNTPSYNSSGFFTFNGTTNQGSITNNSSLDFSLGQTLLIIMRHSYTSGRKNPWDQAYGGYGTLTHENGENINYFFGDAGTNNTPYVASTSMATPRNVWNFMCTTRDTAQQLWYRNDTVSSVYTHSYNSLLYTPGNITIGNGYAGYWQGDMAMILAYNRALSSSEVTQNFFSFRSRFGV